MIVLLWMACTHDPSGAAGPSDDSATSRDDSAVLPLDADSDGWALGDDCDDSDPDANPDADEVCNGIDDDCDGTIDSGAVDALSLYPDADGDGFGALDPIVTCDPKAGIATGTDCDDTNPDVNPAAACDDPFDGIDNDCDGTPLEIPVAYTVAGSTDTSPDEFQTVESGPVALRVISTSTSPMTGTERHVHVEATKPMVLVLSSSKAVDWIVEETVPGTVQQIVVNSDEESTATGPKGVPIDSYLGRSKLFGYQHDWSASGNRSADSDLFAEYGIHVTSWVSHTSFAAITVRDGDAWPSAVYEYPNPGCPPEDVPFTAPDTTVLPKECDPLLASGQTICLATSSARTILFDMDGDLCVVTDTGFDATETYLSIAWLGEYLYGVDGGQVVRMRLSDGRIERSYTYADYGVFDQSLGLYTAAEGDFGAAIHRYESWADVLDGGPFTDLPGHVLGMSYSARDDVIWSAWFSTSVLLRASMIPPKERLSNVALEDFDTWLGSFDVTDDDRIVVRGSIGSTTDVYVFDIDGNAIGTFDLSEDDGGVACFTP